MSKGVTLRVNVPGKGPEQSPTSQLGTRVPAQDYEKLRRQALASDGLFEDPYFPADDSSLFYSQKLPFKPEWKRPGEINKDPKLFTGGADRFDVKQGMLGDCWLVSAIASLTQDKILLNKVVPEDQGWGYGYAGIFHFHFWHFGEWVDIVIDDRLPTHNGRLIFIHSQDDNEFWSALLEKAYAKLYGGYEALKGGKTSEAMEDFTGGVVEFHELGPKAGPDLFTKIYKNAKRSTLMSCSITAAREEVEAKLDNGLVKGHAYSVTGATTVTSKGKEVKLVRIRNPWGQKEWNGDWSDSSNMWNSVSADKRRELDQSKKDDGEFWMSFDDFCKHFTDFEACNVTIDALYEDEAAKSWNSLIRTGSWLNKSAGGCRNFPSFTDNPQFPIYLDEDDDGDGKCSCLIALMQKNRRKQKKMGVQDLCIGFSLYKAPDENAKSVDKNFVDYNYSTGTSGTFTNAREVQKRFDLDPGCYIIIPCAFKPGEEGDFLLRIFTEKSSEKKTTDAKGAVQDSKASQLDQMWGRLAGEDGEIDSEELQDILTASLTKDMSSGSVFSIDACRSMITMLDTDNNGTLNKEEFQTLLQTIAAWKKMFFQFDKDRSGTLEKREVASAIRSLGYDLSPEALTIMFNRFARKRKHMRLDDFAACLSRVKIMDDTFKKNSKGGRTSLTKDEFFKITLHV